MALPHGFLPARWRAAEIKAGASAGKAKN